MLCDIAITVFHGAHKPVVHAASHVVHEKKNCMVFYVCVCMRCSSYSYGALLGSPLGCLSRTITSHNALYSQVKTESIQFSEFLEQFSSQGSQS